MIANEVITLGAGVAAILCRGRGHSNDARPFIIQSALADLFIGGSSVNATNGISVAANAQFPIDLIANETLYGFSAAGGAVKVMAGRSGSPTEVDN